MHNVFYATELSLNGPNDHTAPYLGNEELLQREPLLPHSLAVLLDLQMHVVDDGVLRPPRQDLVDHELAQFNRQAAPVASHDVQTLQLLLGLQITGCVARDGKRGVLLLLQEKHAFEDAVDIQLQEAIQFVHFRLDLQRKRKKSQALFLGHMHHEIRTKFGRNCPNQRLRHFKT